MTVCASVYIYFVCMWQSLWVCLLTNRKMPEREDDHLTPATRLLEKRREMAEVEQALAAQKEVSVCVCVCVCV